MLEGEPEGRGDRVLRVFGEHRGNEINDPRAGLVLALLVIDFPQDNLIVFAAVNPFPPLHRVLFLGVTGIFLVSLAGNPLNQIRVFIIAGVGAILRFRVMKNVDQPVCTIEFFGPGWYDKVKSVNLIESEHLPFAIPEHLDRNCAALLHLVNATIDFALEVGAMLELIIKPVANGSGQLGTLIIKGNEGSKCFVRIKLLNVVGLEFLDQRISQLELEVGRSWVWLGRLPSAVP